MSLDFLVYMYKILMDFDFEGMISNVLVDVFSNVYVMQEMVVLVDLRGLLVSLA